MKSRATYLFTLYCALEVVGTLVDKSDAGSFIVRMILLAILCWQFGEGKEWARWVLAILTGPTALLLVGFGAVATLHGLVEVGLISAMFAIAVWPKSKPMPFEPL
jgi:hypothetical protein